MGEQVFNINFVKTVQKFPCVYDHTRIDYCLRHVNDKAWAQISDEVGEDVKTCKEKWKNLRTVFRRNLLRNEGTTKRPYYLNEHMQFMIPLLNGPKTRGRSWFQYQKVEQESLEESWEETSIADEGSMECEEEAGGVQEDPLQMVETVIKKEEPEVEEALDGEKIQTKTVWMGNKAVTLHKCGPEEVRRLELKEERRQAEEEEPARKRLKSLLEVESRANSCLDCPDTQFLLSLKPDLQQMTAKQKRRFKKEIFNLLDAILEDSKVPLGQTSAALRNGQKK